MNLDFLYLDPNSSDQSSPTLQYFQIQGKQGKLYGNIYLASGQGPHPTVIITNGYPGHEKNLDLAQALRRTGFHVVTFFYSGSWGSEGVFSFLNSIQDTREVLQFVLENRDGCFDRQNIFFVSHSLGCIAAAHMIAEYPEVRGGAFIMPYDPANAYLYAQDNPRDTWAFIDPIEEGTPFLNGTSTDQLTQEIRENLPYFSMGSMIRELSEKPLLWISSQLDTGAPEGINTLPFMEKLKDFPNNRVTWQRFRTDHYCSNMRIRLSHEIGHFLFQNVVQHKTKLNPENFYEDLKTLIRNNYLAITLEDVAAYFNVSVPYVSSLIHQKTGTTFTAIVTLLKVQEAKNLLEKTDWKIQELSEYLGYNDASYFMKTFKKSTGVTPSQYRAGVKTAAHPD